MVTYEPGFREQAVKMASEVGPIKAAQDLGVPVNTLYTWIKQSKEQGEYRNDGSKRQTTAIGEATKMAKRIKELERANQILKEALSFFVVSQKK